jgi:hypothetical protein
MNRQLHCCFDGLPTASKFLEQSGVLGTNKL